MEHRLLFWILSMFAFMACQQKTQKERFVSEQMVQNNPNSFEFATWITSSKNKSDADYISEFKKYKAGGIDEVLINTSTDPNQLKRLVPLATSQGLKVHAWIMALNRPGDTVALQHPEWYAVSKEGKSCYDTRPYVSYYQWLCPTRAESRNHVLGLIEGLAKVEGIESVHLDYIRFSDIFLPIGLLPKYNLKQERELPEFDFCYCEVCVSAFEKRHHKNPRNIENTAIDMEWKQFRLNAVKSVVDEAYAIAKKYNKRLTAAVFPYPEMADHMVRQRWDKWKIDEVYPMIYHGFYNEDIAWVGFATGQGVADLKYKETTLNTGLYLPDFKTPEALKEAIIVAKQNGAKGVSFFEGPNLTEAYLKTIKAVKESL